MNANQTAAQTAATTSPTRHDFRLLTFGGLGLFALVAALRLYQQLFAWSEGLDSFSPEYAIYWHNLLVVSVPAAFLGALGLGGYLWRTRDRNLDSLSPEAELGRHMALAQWLTLLAVAIYFAFSFFTEQTAVWHMTAVRDTDFTPSNIVTFYISYPLFVVLGVGAYFYATTRLPFYAKGYSLPFVIFVVGTFMAIPNIGFNEWGHTFWYMDEGFAGPLHWGFVLFGWMTLGCFGVALQILARLRQLFGDECAQLIAARAK